MPLLDDDPGLIAGVRIWSGYGVGVNEHDVWIGLEIVNIKGEQIRDAVRLHDCDKARIVYLFAYDGMQSDQLQPNREDGRGLFQEWEDIEDLFDLQGGILWTPAKSIDGQGARYHSPELDEILRGYIDVLAPRQQTFNGLDGRYVAWRCGVATS